MLIKKKKTVKEIVVPVTKATAISNSGFNFNNPITQEIENQAQSLVQKKSEALLEEFNREIAVKKSHAEEEIQQMIQEAQTEAATIVEEANAYKKTAEIEIYDTKKLLENERNQIVILKEQELKQSFEEGMSKASEIIAELMNYLATFHHAKKNVIEESKKEIMSIAFDLVNQILGYEVETNDEVLQTQVERAISKVVTAKGIMQIYLHPKDIDKVAFLEKALLKVLDPSIKLVFQKDESIDQGSCIVNTQGGRLDASFSGQIKVLKEVLGRYLGYEIKPLKDPMIEPKNELLEGLIEVKIDPLDDLDFENLSLEDYLLQHGENVDNNIIDNIDLEDETMSILELESQDSKELGANDFSDQEAELMLGDDDLDDPDEDLDDDSDDLEEEDDDLEDDVEDLDEEEVEEEEDEDFEDDEDVEEYNENPDDDDDTGDDRFPEY